MDVQFLISEIFGKPALWDQKDKNHHNRFVLDKLWSDVASKLKTTPTVVRNKWKTLRDKFRTTLASIPKPKSGDAQSTNYRGEWKYFQSLLFLKNQFTPRKSSGNLIEQNAHETILEDFTSDMSQGDRDNDDEWQNDISIIHTTNESPRVISSNQPSTSGNKSQVKRSNKRNIGDALLQVEKEKLQYLQEKRAKKDEDDEDLSFFKSLLPHVRTFSAYEKMDYRMRVMKVTKDYLKPSQATTTVSNCTVGDTTETTVSNYSGNVERHFNLSELVPNSYQNL